MRRTTRIAVIIAILLSSTTAVRAQNPGAEAKARSLFKRAQKLEEKGLYDKAHVVYQRIVNDYAESEVGAEARRLVLFNRVLRARRLHEGGPSRTGSTS